MLDGWLELFRWMIAFAIGIHAPFDENGNLTVPTLLDATHAEEP